MITGPLFPALQACNKKYIVIQGGGDAGKTVTILQHLAVKNTLRKNTITTIVGQDVPNLKKGALRAFQKYVAPDPDIQEYIKAYNSTERLYTFTNKSVSEFISFGDEQDARGSERDNLFMNEANAFSYQMFWQLKRKTRGQIILDYNPTERFWVHDKLLSGKDPEYAGKVAYFQVDHRHNPFLTEEEHEAYENISDPDLFKVYARGETGLVKGKIYSYKLCERIPEDCTSIIWGLDYGYTSDQTAIMKIGVRGKDRFVQECYYDPLDDADAIKMIMVENGWNPEQYVFSEHDKRIISELLTLGVPVFLANKKNKISNISKVKSFNLFITDSSANCIREADGYKLAMATNINTGEEITTNKPIDGNDHCMDGMLYAIATHAIMLNL